MAMVLPGCVSIPTYVPPAKEYASYLHFDTPGLAYFFLHLNGENCTGNVSIPPELSPFAHPEKTLIVPANKTVGLTLVWGAPPSHKGFVSCAIQVSFNLKPARHYRLVGKLEGEFCEATIVGATPGETVTPSDIKLTQMKHVNSVGSVMFGQGSATCIPK